MKRLGGLQHAAGSLLPIHLVVRIDPVGKAYAIDGRFACQTFQSHFMKEEGFVEVAGCMKRKGGG